MKDTPHTVAEPLFVLFTDIERAVREAAEEVLLEEVLYSPTELGARRVGEQAKRIAEHALRDLDGWPPALGGLLGYVQHDSWRCEHPPRYYLVDVPPQYTDGRDCPCGLIATLRALGIDPEPWMPPGGGRG